MESPYQSPNAHPYGLGQEQTAKPPVLAWWGIIPAVIFAIAEAAVGWREANPDGTKASFAVGYVVGGIIGGLFIAFFVAWIVYRLSRRSQFAGTIAFSLMIGFVCLSVLEKSLHPQAPEGVESAPSTTPTLASFGAFQFVIPAGWAKVQPDTPSTVAELLHGGAVWTQADGMLKVDLGTPAFPTVRKMAESFVGDGGHILPSPVSIDGVEGVRVETLSTNMSRPRFVVVVFRGEKAYLIMAAATRGADVSAAFDQVLKSWRWNNTH